MSKMYRTSQNRENLESNGHSSSILRRFIPEKQRVEPITFLLPTIILQKFNINSLTNIAYFGFLNK